MSSHYAEPLARLETCLDEIGSVNPTFRTVEEKQELLVALMKAKTRIDAELMRMLAVADDVAEATDARSTSAWLAAATNDSPGRLRAETRLAKTLDDRWSVLQQAFRAGEVNLAQVRVIDKSLSDLPDDLSDDLVTKAERLLVEEAAHHGPRDLAILGERILEHLAPEVAEHAEYTALLAAEDRASDAVRLSLRRRGDGSHDGTFRISDFHAGMLRTFLAAFTNPSRHESEFADLPLERKQGIGFTALLESVLAKQLPRHGGKATTVAIVLQHDQLLADLDEAGITTTTAGERLTAAQARRLACQGGLMAAVLGAHSEVLDLGRVSRLFNPAQRRALEIRHRTCSASDCSIPAAFCHAHHKNPWAKGGKTNLADGTLLCPFHHRRAHHPHWQTTYHPNGTTTFTRRQ